MKNILKSHFVYTISQRNGVLFLVGLILLLQVLLHFVDFESESKVDVQDETSLAFQQQIDSLRVIAIENRTPKIYPFNPNFISDYKGYQLGMSSEEIDRLHNFRSKNKYVNSAKEFQKITRVSDSLLNKMSPYFKFPDWVTKRNIRSKKKVEKNSFNHKVEKDTSLISSTDLNKATMIDFLAVEGVDDELSERIIKYRSKLKGFVFPDQIFEVWGMDKSTGENLLKIFSVQSLPKIEKLNINTASFKEVLKIPYIDYDLCVKIFDYRDEVAELQSITELKNIEGFPMNKYDRIVLYLQSK
jgi:DNA uptake protein ComE-like DNA-binding protein